LAVARLPVTTDRNPYQRLLYQHLQAEGIDLVGDGRLDPSWLEAHRATVDVLHVHWRLDRLVDDEAPFGPARTWTADRAAEAAHRLGGQLAHARAQGFVLAWTVHEIAQLGGSEPTLEHLAAVELGRHANVVLTHNRVATATVTELGLADPALVRTVPLGHYADAHPANESLTRADLGIDADAVVFLAFGHQRSDKALDLLLAAHASLDRPDVVLIVAGHTDPITTTDPTATAAGPGRVITLGAVADDEVVALHRLADAAVVARGYEWTPSSLILSLSLGRAVVAADLASVSEHGGPGVFPFHPGDVDDLAATLARVADDPTERRIRGQAGMAFVRALTWEDTARATADAFRGAVAKHGAADGRDTAARRRP